MKSLIASTLLLLLLAFAQADIDVKKAMEILEQCKKEAGATEDIKTLIESKTIPESHEGKCMLACALEKKGLIKDQKFDKEAMAQFFQEKVNNDEKKLEKIAAAIGVCSAIDVKGLEYCERVAKHIQCGKDQMVEW